MTKTDLTKLILKESDLDISFDKAYKLWWYKDIRDTNFRLKPKGYLLFTELTPCYKFKVGMWSTPQTFKDLSNLNCPYYIEHISFYASQITEVYIFSDKIAMTIKLYQDFDTYLKTLK